MDYEWDEGKRKANLLKHGIDFQAVSEFCWDDAEIEQDARQDYQEKRYTALGFIGNRLHLLIFSVRNNTIRIISLRKANKREGRNYENKTGTHFPG
ncbi:MAG: hypothetical protein A2521_01290 [Deltaproteobacteria bacterium RIFOXYD12_FULL_57_12]|nr:MAG: hypothetical protein A2521_01290 [Deltaproteobacteria bacterium RIFOXYD12_FULL_57_12]